MRSQTTVFQELYGGKTAISRQVSKVLLGVNRRTGGNDCQYGGRKIWERRKDVSITQSISHRYQSMLQTYYPV